MSYDLPTREEFIERILQEKQRNNINIDMGVYKRAMAEADKAEEQGLLKKL